MTIHALLQVLQKARDETKAILKNLEQTGHPQTNESSSLYLALVTIHKRLAGRAPGAPVGDCAADLEQLVGLCTGKLEPLKPLLDDAVKMARGPV